VKFEVVLVHPEIPQNTGNVARTCAAVGAVLHLVHPLGFTVDDRSVRRAGLDYWHLVKVVEHDSLASFLAVAKAKEVYLFSSHGTVSLSAVGFGDEGYLVFGCETRGLPRDLLESGIGPVVRIPTAAGARCLNLSNAVAVGIYEALRQSGYSGLVQPDAT
jgi:tRNA (cytidine/uridine-2'-O-)-methyltransferase